MTSSALDPERRARLAGVKLRALVRDNFGDRAWQGASLATTAAVHDGTDGFVLISSLVELGAALAWSVRAGLAGALTVLAEPEAEPAIVARRAAEFDPAPRVFRTDGRRVEAAVAAGHEPAPIVPTEALAVLAPLVALGASVTVEWGVAAAEVEGLEVGRAVVGPQGTWTLEIGVGRFDREASAIMEKVRSREDMVSSVVTTVRAFRRPNAEPHLLNRTARQRWLRAKLVAQPGLVGAERLENIEPAVARHNLVDPAPAFAAGPGIVVAASVGVNLDAVPAALDARARHRALRGDDRAPLDLVLVAPQRDQYPVEALLAGRARDGCRLVAVDGDWPSGAAEGLRRA